MGMKLEVEATDAVYLYSERVCRAFGTTLKEAFKCLAIVLTERNPRRESGDIYDVARTFLELHAGRNLSYHPERELPTDFCSWMIRKGYMAEMSSLGCSLATLADEAEHIERFQELYDETMPRFESLYSDYCRDMGAEAETWGEAREGLYDFDACFGYDIR